MKELFKYNKEHKFYWTSKKFGNKTCVIMFFKNYRKSYELEWGVSKRFAVGFAIGKDRKQVMYWATRDRNFLDLKITGTGKIKFLVWAKNMLLEFEKFICDKHKGELISIAIAGSDKRRFETYKHALAKYGYKEETPGLLNKLIRRQE